IGAAKLRWPGIAKRADARNTMSVPAADRLGYAVVAVDPRRTLYASFLAALPDAVRERLVSQESTTSATLSAQWSAAVAAYPEIDVPADRFAGELARRIGTLDTSDATMAAVEAARGSDVYLAIACCDRD